MNSKESSCSPEVIEFIPRYPISWYIVSIPPSLVIDSDSLRDICLGLYGFPTVIHHMSRAQDYVTYLFKGITLRDNHQRNYACDKHK